MSPDRRWVSEGVCKCTLGSQPGLPSHLQGYPPVRHSFILNRGNNRREPEYELHKSTSGRSCLRALWDAGCKRWFGGLEATCLPHPHTLGRQGHNSSQWLGSHLPTPFSTALMSKVLIRDDGMVLRDEGCLPCLHPGAGRKTNGTLGSAFCWPRNWSLHIQLHASLLPTQGGFEGDALPEGL